MIFITKKLLDRLTRSHREPNMFMCYSTPQSLSAKTSRAILLINEDTLIILFLNFFSTKVVHKVEFRTAELQDQKYHSGTLLSATWSFHVHGRRWKFMISKKILTLGSMQSDFLHFMKQHIYN